MAAAVVQVYKTSTDYLSDAYPHFPVRDDRKIFPAVAILENWRMFGPLMMNKLDEAVRTKMHGEGLLAGSS